MILLSFILSLAALALNLWIFPGIHLLALAPFCVLCIQLKPLQFSLFSAAFSGILYDCLSGSSQFGLYSLCYSLSALLLFFMKKRLPFRSIPLLTVAFSMIYTLFHLALFQSFFSLRAFVSTFLVMSFIDGLYAFFWHTLPLVMYTRLNESPRYRY